MVLVFSLSFLSRSAMSACSFVTSSPSPLSLSLSLSWVSASCSARLCLSSSSCRERGEGRGRVRETLSPPHCVQSLQLLTSGRRQSLSILLVRIFSPGSLGCPLGLAQLKLQLQLRDPPSGLNQLSLAPSTAPPAPGAEIRRVRCGHVRHPGRAPRVEFSIF